MLKKPALTCIKRSCNYNFLTLGIDDKYKDNLRFLHIFCGCYFCWSLLWIVKRLYPLLCQCGLLKHFEVIIIYQSTLYTDALRPGFILLAVFTFQIVVFQCDYDGSTKNYMKILRRHRSDVYYTSYLKRAEKSALIFT